MQVTGFALALAAVLAGASAVAIQPISEPQLYSHIAVRNELLSDMRTKRSAKAKRCFVDDNGDTECIDCMIFGDDDCCTTTDTTTGETRDDGCEYFGGTR